MVSKKDRDKAVKAKVSEFIDSFEDVLNKNLAAALKNKIIPAVIQAYTIEYDRLSDLVEGLFPAKIRGRDALSLKRERSLFVSQLSKEVEKASFINGELSIKIQLRGEENATGPPTTADSLNFYIDGAIDEFAFITPEHFKKRRPHSDANLGRVGEGFLISINSYKKEKWQEITGVPFEEIRHPISGFPPYKGFNDVAARVDFEGLILEAFEKTTKDLTGRSF